MVRLGVSCGADVILCETMSDMYELMAAVLAAKENSSLPVFATVVFDESGKMLTGGTPKAAVAMLEGLGVDALGTNCSLGPVQMKAMAAELVKYASVPVIVNPNAGLPHSENGKTVYDIGPEEFVRAMKDMMDLGVSAVGGCCGTTPEHIRLLKQASLGRPAPVLTPKEETIVTSYAAAQTIGEDSIIVGERINPTGKKKMKQALLERDYGYILNMALEQQEKGAHVLDVNVGVPGLDEKTVLKEPVEQLQSVTELPLQIDTSDYSAMEAAMRAYNGKPMVNSVSGKQESMDAVFPLVKKYGGVVVALALDDGGIPATAEGRAAVARKIYAEAERYGIPKKDILIDCLCLTVSSDRNGALVTLDALRRIRDEFHGRTILGVSNISFGLPQREIINQAFYTMALQCGLNAGIINPNADGMMRAYRAYRALTARDENCGEYISAYADYRPPLPKGAVWAGGTGGGQQTAAETPGGRESAPGASFGQSGAMDPQAERLIRCVTAGLKEESGKLAESLAGTQAPLDVINSCLIPALDQVGKDFETGRVFLPQLLMSAEAAKSAFAVLQDRMAESGRKGEKKGTVILATVKGDIHDIGKNIVKVLLESYRFEVIDLGRDVPPETVVNEAIQRNVRLVGLSALMTTTVASMEETIRQLHEKAPDVKIMVGGAVMTKEYALSIHADRYCRDAMASVSYAEEVFA